MRVIAGIVVVFGMLLVSCGDDPVAGPREGQEPNEQAGETEDQDMLEGTLGGDARLEGGCAWLDTPDGRFEVIYPEGYEISFDPLALRGPDGEEIAREGEVVRVEGRIAGDIMSVCQVGTIFEASAVVTDS